MESKLKELEKRIAKLESIIGETSKPRGSSATEKQLVADLDAFMHKHSGLFAKGFMFSGVAMPSDSPRRFVRWSGCGGFKNDTDFGEFIDKADPDVVARFSANFSSPEKLSIVKALIKNGPLGQKEILAITHISQGQFYHHLKDLISSKLVEKLEKDKYDLSSMGYVLSISFIGIINSFCK